MYRKSEELNKKTWIEYGVHLTWQTDNIISQLDYEYVYWLDNLDNCIMLTEK